MRVAEPEVDWGPGQASLLAGIAVFLGGLVAGRSQDLLPSPDRLALVFAAMVVLALIALPAFRPHAQGIVVVLLVGGGLLLRWVSATHPGGSDVLPVTNEAISVVLGGGNPYNHFYESSRPPGAPFPYPPVNLLIHLPGYLLGGLDGVRSTEFIAGLIVLILLARPALLEGHPLAVPMLALYAALGNLVNLVGDGSNDTSAGAMLVLFMLALVRADREDRWRAILAGVLAAAALGTKQSALPLVIAGSAWLFHADPRQFRRYLAALLVTLVIVSVPFLLTAGPVGYVRALTAFAGFHEDVYGWNIWVLAQQLQWPVASREDALLLGTVIGLGAMLAIALPRYRSVRTALVAGTVGTAVLFLAQRWTAYSYFAQLVSILVVLPLVRPWDWPGPLDDPELPPPAPSSAPPDQNATNPIEIAHTA